MDRVSRPSSSPSSTTPAASSATANSSSTKTSTPSCAPSAPPSTNAASPSNCWSIPARRDSIYCSQEITLICARVGCILRHTAVRDAAAKGKIERFFRRVRDQFLVQKLDLSSLEALNRQFTHWVEQDYNATEHDAIRMKPIDRFGIDLARVRFLAPS